MSENVRIYCGGTGSDVMVKWPSGKVEFLGFLALLKLLWWVASTGRRITIVDEDGKESEA